MTILTFNVSAFRVEFPEFANATTYPDATLQAYWDRATCYINANSDDGDLNGTCRQGALNLLTAHIALLSTQLTAGQVTGQLQSATIDKVSVAITPPPAPNTWQYWLNSTGYGQQLLALLQALAVGGFQTCMLPETAGFRRIGGIFI